MIIYDCACVCVLSACLFVCVNLCVCVSLVCAIIFTDIYFYNKFFQSIPAIVDLSVNFL